MSSPALWLEIFDYCLKMGKRAFPRDNEMACEVASDCFDRFLRLHADDGLENYQAWVGRSIACLKKNAARENARKLDVDPEDLAIHHLCRQTPQQEPSYDAGVFRKCIQRLPEREQWAMEILADGGSIKDVTEEMYIGPREALALVHQARIKLLDWTMPPCPRA